ncbi:MAG: CoA transferase [Chloroflexi bacterium]|nr:CoA transferase [Chloroflexota bacterium]MDA1240071.1 CoA transferase [Chloroflexota bacterium]
MIAGARATTRRYEGHRGRERAVAGVLDGIRVLEFSQIVAAPVAGVNLSDFGADVIKVEPPGGEQTRNTGAVIPKESKGFQALNRGKRSLVVDLRDPRGHEVIQRLVRQTDVVLINYRFGVAERMGIDYETLRAIRPNLIYWQNTGFGEQGPEAYRAGSDVVAQAYSGLMVNDSKMDDTGAPDLIAIPIADIASGFAAAMGVGMALYHREKTGEGQYLSTSLLRTSLFLQAGLVMREPVTDAVLRDQLLIEIDEAMANGASYADMLAIRKRRAGLRVAFRLYYGGYRAKDGAVVLGALTKANRDKMRVVLGFTDENSDEPGYDAMDPANQTLAHEWKDRFRARFMERSVEEWVRDFDAAGVPVSPVRNPEVLSEDPQVIADGMMWDIEHSITGPQRVVGPAVNMSATPTRVQRAAPALGEHSAEVLTEGGFTPAEIAALCEAGVLVLQ